MGQIEVHPGIKMKIAMKPTISSLALPAFGMFLFLGYTTPEGIQVAEAAASTTDSPADTVVIEYTGRIKEIIDQKCYSCHSAEGDDEEAREELLWDELPKLAPMDQVYTLDAIAESVKDGDMPPFTYVLWRPGKRLSDEEARLLIDWAKDLSDRLYKGME